MNKKPTTNNLEHKIDLLSNIVEQGFNSVGGKVNSLEKKVTSLERKVTRGFKSVEERMERGFATVADDIADIQDIMPTKDDVRNIVREEITGATEKQDLATKKDIQGIVSSAHNRIDQELNERKKLEVRVTKLETLSH